MEQLLLGFPSDTWVETKDGDPAGRAMYERHYSSREYADGRRPKLFVGPGGKLVLMTPERDALFVWRKFRDHSGQRGVNCAVFRNEGWRVSSGLIRRAERFAWARWFGSRLYTYVNSGKVKGVHPGTCFRLAGWADCGRTKGGLLILEKWPFPWQARRGRVVCPHIPPVQRL